MAPGRFSKRLPKHAAASLTLLALCGVAWAAPAVARPLALDEVPAPLRAWTDWVLHGHESERCPFLFGASEKGDERRPCAWPSELRLELGDQRGRFVQRWQIFAAARVPLPGGTSHWPLDVEVDGRSAPVTVLNSLPMVELEAGAHTLSGSFEWDALPEMLAIPPETALVSLQLRGRDIALPDRDESGRLWLERRKLSDDGDASRVDVVVHRKVIDEIPLQLETQIELRVGGRSREVLLGTALPGGFVPMTLTSPLPARLDTDGRLRVQLRPGSWTLTLVARHDGPVTEIAPPPQAAEPGANGDAQWDAQEVWVFDARPQLRVVEVSGATLVDPNQTTLPTGWRNLPAYLMERGSVLRLEEKRRGDQDPAPDDLTLARTWWLDFDGEGFTVTDRIAGVVRRSTRLEMREPIELGRVALDGNDQFITRSADGAGPGIEIPLGKIQLVADSRIPARSGLSAVGWDHDFQSLSADLWLPPGWRLFHARGVDRATPTWLNRWTLLDLFVVLVVAMGVQRFWGKRWGVLALAALAIGYTEPDAPRWLWLAVLIGEGLHRNLPAGRFSRGVGLYRAVALALLLLVAVSFGITQLRVALYPVLGPPGGVLMSSATPRQAIAGYTGSEFEEESADRVARQGLIDEMVVSSEVAAQAPRALAAKGYLGSFAKRYRSDPQARITTGPGLPAWTWNRVTLFWSGPVGSDQRVGFVLIPPWLVGLLGFLRVALMAALLLRLLGLSPDRGEGGHWLAGWLRARGRARAAATIVTLLVWIGTPATGADFPSQEMLDQLRANLLEPPDCYPQCASIPRLRLAAEARSLTLRLEVDAAADTAIPLPGGMRSWTPAEVILDGVSARGLWRDPKGFLWIRMTPGRHQIGCSGPLPDRDSVEIALPLQPLRVTVTSRDWTVHGLREDGRAEPALQLARERRETSTKLEPGELPPFLVVTRELSLDLDWRATTEVARATPDDTALLVEVPLLPGETVTSAEIRVRDGKAVVSLAPGEHSARWDSQLEVSSSLTLNAPEGVAWTEWWRLGVSPIWHVETQGIPPIHANTPDGARVREWRPWPGESVRFDITRPAGVEGATLTIDQSLLQVTPGLRSTDSKLTVSLRSSRGGQHSIELPEDASVQSVTIDGQLQPIRQDERSVTLPIHPGAQSLEIAWREPRGFKDALLLRTPAVDLGAPSVNAQILLEPSIGRWILALGGSGAGPVVLFWSVLVALAAIAVGLSRLSLTPLRFHEWLLLGVGLTQVPIAAATVVAFWLLALGWRAQRGMRVPGRWFDLLQLALVALTGAALVALLFSIHRGLLGSPEMQIAGNGSTAEALRWYQDRATETPAQTWLLSVPVFVYRLAMLAWALWIAQALLRWLRWGWECFSHGELWRPLRPIRRPAHPS